jgi:hypothetical protein
MKTVNIDERLQETIEHLLPGFSDINIGLGHLLAREIERELAVYEQMDKNFADHYGMSFDEFGISDLMRDPPFAVEQDYFDWELAVTIIQQLRQDLAKVYAVVKPR